MFFVYSFIIVCAVIGVLAVVRRGMRSRRLSSSASAVLRRELSQLQIVPDAARRVLEAEKIVDHALTALGYHGTFAEKLQKAGPRFSSVQSLWDAHKLRNRIAHERAVQVDGAHARSAMMAFDRALRDLSS